MSGNAGQDDQVLVGLEAGGHRPEHVLGVEEIDVLVDHDDMLELGVDTEGEGRRPGGRL
ncbi:hypothetical protein [Streptomyces sp. Tu 4128]|uniref:hypothetical protein n=1 Tax=Streptomyces sp. Tu 4128 TaxID=1120314 RepID=UPI001F11C544|nr:hypothetical protein [Streptomyces sp. Tu 4128]